MGFSIRKFCAETGLAHDIYGSILYGELASYPISVQYNRRRSLLICRISCKPDGTGEESELAQTLERFRLNRTGISQIQYKDRVLAAVIAIPARKSTESTAENVRAFVQFAASQRMLPCCQGCGAEAGWRHYALDGSGVVICDACRSYTERNMAEVREAKTAEKPNVAGLIAGMLCGAAVLFLLTYILLRLGYVAYLTGYIGALVGFLTMKKLGKKLTTPAVIAAVVLFLATAAFVPVFDIAKDIAEFNTENAADFSAFMQTYESLQTETSTMNADEKAQAEAILGISFAELDTEYAECSQAVENQSTADCLRNFTALWGNSLYAEVHSEVVKCILWGVLSVLIGSAVTLPAMLRESRGIHKLRELPA